MNLSLYRPIISNNLTQDFGESKACINLSTQKITGKRNGLCAAESVDFYQSIGLKYHNGQDWGAWHGEPVFHCSTFDGWIKSEKDMQGGIGVDVISNEPLTIQFWKGTRKTTYTGYVKVRYWHLKTVLGHDGKQVKLGEQIGLADNTGASSGDHVHLGIKKCHKDGRPLELDDGLYGCFDPRPFMKGETDAKSAAEYLHKEAPALSPQETKEMLSQLSMLTRLLNAFLELKRRL
jgi:murein DD-endopeptidase MepM/ murein hydrolase activator NlpD